MSDELMNKRAEERAERTRYLQQVSDLLTDLEPEIYHDTLRVGGLQVWPTSYRSRDIVKVHTGYSRRGSGRSFRNTEPAHIAAAVRRIVAERAEKNRQAQAYMAGIEASQARTEAASAQVRAVVARVNDTVTDGNPQSRWVGPVEEWEADETADLAAKGEARYSYHYRLELRGLTEAQALAILAIVEATQPVHWPAAPAAAQKGGA
jgi:hypothetical protein